MVYCLVPRDLAPRVHACLRRHFADDAAVEVIVDERGQDRRGMDRRDHSDASEAAGERRRIRAREGRRVAERRAALVVVDGPPLPRRVRSCAQRLLFVERIETLGSHAEDLDTARLVTRIQSGDRDAFAILYMRYFDRVYTYMRTVFGKPQDAEDVTQQVFIDVLNGIGRYERRAQPFRAWLFTVARNHALRRLARRKQLDLLAPEDLARLQAPAPSVRLEPDTADLDALGWISDRELTGLTDETVRKQHSRALSFLRARLAAVGRAPRRTSRAGTRLLIKRSGVLRGRRFSLIAPGASR
jgi:DNA-directed RNA polymerase specialized sigma24 family protein